MKRVDENFKTKVFELVGSIPKGRVMTYGQVASLAGASWAAWEVGQIAHYGPSDLPWQRVVNKHGGLARGYTWGSLEGHKKALVDEGVEVDSDYKIDLAKYLWQPIPKNQSSLL